MMARVLKIIFFAFIVKPVVLVVLGLNVGNRQNLPRKGPAVVVANHNSHLDTLVLMSLYPLLDIHRIRPVAAADYFLSNRLVAWFSLNVIGIIPLERKARSRPKVLFEQCEKALDNGDVLIIFPEGSRGQPEQLGTLKRGVYHLLKNRQDTVLTPVVMHGLGRALPRGDGLLVPFNCDVMVGESIAIGADGQELIDNLTIAYKTLLDQCLTRRSSDVV
ncbi:lysophospholipid acyltransferase family protein [Gilvimarinus polysaccharolyticus]|uniref:lysophospholipid acyltransferase family protein n=1 Tax=Gilvimarinus polysaccharolyticus TaxID=863921 RepID=UPI000A9BA050|nr:lysophospholipid acyltransferase family protein [Gilvimarinus polysaccharolyticus]